MTADNALDHALVSKMVAARAGSTAITLTSRVEQCHILRVTGLNKALFQSLGQGLRAGAAYETAGCDGIAIVYQKSSFVSSQNFYFLHVNQSFLCISKV